MTPDLAQRPHSTLSPNMSSGRLVQFILLVGAVAAAACARVSLSPLQETMQVALALTDNQIALLQGSAYALPMLLGSVPLGLAVDRYSRVRLLFVLTIFTLSSGVLTALTSNFTLLFAARCIVGLTAPATSMAAMSVLADLYGPAERGRANMILGIGGMAGASAAFALGGNLLVFFTGPDSWRWAMLWLTSPILLIVLLMLMLREPVRSGQINVNPPARAAVGELWLYRGAVAPLLIGITMVGMADTGVLIWAAPTLSRSFALSPDRVGAFMGIALLISGLLGPIVGGFLADFCQRVAGPRRTLTTLSGLALLSAVPGLFAVVPEFGIASVLLVTFIAMGSAMAVMTSTLAMVALPNELRGLFLAISSVLSSAFCLGLAPMMISLLAGAMGGSEMIGAALAIICAVVSILGAMTFAIGRRHFPIVDPH